MTNNLLSLQKECLLVYYCSIQVFDNGWLYMSNISSIYKIMEKDLVNTADIHLMRWLMVFCKCQTMEVYLKKWNHSQPVLGAHTDLQTVCNNSVSPHQRPQHTDGKPLCSLSRPHQSSLHSDMVSRKLLKVYYGDWLVYDAITLPTVYYIRTSWSISFCEQICSEESDTLFVNFEVFHSVHFHILDVSGHLVGVSKETSFCEVQLNYNAKVRFMAALFYKTWGVMNVEVLSWFLLCTQHLC
jgi:hypothetical protein